MESMKKTSPCQGWNHDIQQPHHITTMLHPIILLMVEVQGVGRGQCTRQVGQSVEGGTGKARRRRRLLASQRHALVAKQLGAAL